jgi:hypothetical protein
MHRKFAIRKCAQVARVQGFYAFAIENGGHCLGGKNILQTYSMYGPSRACRQHGKGGPWSMEVYKFTSKSICKSSDLLGYMSSMCLILTFLLIVRIRIASSIMYRDKICCN